MKKKYKQKIKGFSLAETMICLLVVSVILAASLPVFTKRVQSNGAPESFWSATNSTIFNTNQGNIGFFNTNPPFGVTVGATTGTHNYDVIMYGKLNYGGIPVVPSGQGGMAWIPSKSVFKASLTTDTAWNSTTSGIYSTNLASDADTTGEASTAIVAGTGSHANGLASIVVGGNTSNATGPMSVIINSINSTNTASAGNSFQILNNSGNITNTNAVIASSNYANATGLYSSIIASAGTSSSPINASGFYSSIIASYLGNSTGYDSSVLAAYNSTSSNTESVTIACTNCVNSGAQSVILGGRNNVISGYRSIILGGNNNTVAGNDSVAGGQYMNIPSNVTGFLFGYATSPVLLSSARASNQTSYTNIAGFYVNNVYTRSGVASFSSDSRLKNIIGPYNKGFKEIMTLNPILYKYKEGFGLDSHKLQIGLTAQNVKQAFPEAIAPSPVNNYMTYNFQPIQMALINSIKEVNNETIQINNENSQLLKDSLRLQKELDDLNYDISDAEKYTDFISNKNNNNFINRNIFKLKLWLNKIIFRKLLRAIL